MEQQNQGLFDLQVDQQSISYLSEGARWARFIAVVGFIFCGLMVIAAFFIGTIFATMMSTSMGGSSAALASMGGGFFTFMYLILAALGFIPCLFLYRFGSRMQLAVRNNQQDQMNSGLKNLKSYFRFVGIILIIFLSLYAIAIIGAVIGGLAMR